MATVNLGLDSGSWLVADCGSMPSENNCHIVMMAPESQKEDLISAGVRHMVNEHGHEDNEDLRAGAESFLRPLEVQ